MNHLDLPVFTMYVQQISSITVCFEFLNNPPVPQGNLVHNLRTTGIQWKLHVPSTSDPKVFFPVSHGYTVLTFLVYNSRKFLFIIKWKHTTPTVPICTFSCLINPGDHFLAVHTISWFFLIVSWFMVIYTTIFLFMYI